MTERGVSHIDNIPEGLRDLIATSLALGASSNAREESDLATLKDFGSNPGNLYAWIYVPTALKQGAPLVVVLHGCTQTAAAYDGHAGWSALAERHGFVVLLPEQKRDNNPNLCFNWFAPLDTRRGRGEALSIAQMIEHVHQTYGTNRGEVFITGLSAGGAMTAAMLATYPELFAGGAIIAGLPFGTANNVPQALERMRGHQLPDQATLGKLVRSASNFAGPWPTVSVWHGTQDLTVAPVNAKATIDQWRDIHRAGERPSRVEAIGNHTRRVWHDRNGREVVEEYEVRRLSHGTPLSTLDAESQESPGPHMLEAGISSTRTMARFWGIDRTGGSNSVSADRRDRTDARGARVERRHAVGSSSNRSRIDIASTIGRALRSAGLLR